MDSQPGDAGPHETVLLQLSAIAWASAAEAGNKEEEKDRPRCSSLLFLRTLHS